MLTFTHLGSVSVSVSIATDLFNVFIFTSRNGHQPEIGRWWPSTQDPTFAFSPVNF